MQQTITGPSKPTAAICINKSRLKVYNQTDPTYYMEKGQEFQIELFNPTTNTVLAKIYLNAKQISQGGLVLRPGERVFLDRYLDVAKRFKFDVYEVSNTSEVQKAIKENGDFKVEFYNELLPIYNQIYTYSGPTYNQPWNTTTIRSGGAGTLNLTGANTCYNTSNGGSSLTSTLTSSVGDYSSSSSSSFASLDSLEGSALSDTFGWASANLGNLRSRSASRSASKPASLKKLKSIETGRVEAGSNSEQKLQTVSKSFNYLPFHSTEYKLLPLSQKINTTEDLNVKRYCTKCGHKTSKTDKFCASCGNKI